MPVASLITMVVSAHSARIRLITRQRRARGQIRQSLRTSTTSLQGRLSFRAVTAAILEASSEVTEFQLEQN